MRTPGTLAGARWPIRIFSIGGAKTIPLRTWPPSAAMISTSPAPASLIYRVNTSRLALSLLSTVRAQVAGPTDDQPHLWRPDDGAAHFRFACRAPIHHVASHYLRLHRAAAGR